MHLELNLPAIIIRAAARTTFLRRAYATIIATDTTSIHGYICSFSRNLVIAIIFRHDIIVAQNVMMCDKYFDKPDRTHKS